MYAQQLSPARSLWKAAMAGTVAAMLLASPLLVPKPAFAANGTPNYEVKLNLDPSLVLDSSHNLVSAVRSEFSTGTSTKKYKVQYMDTATQSLQGQDWSDRIRKRDDQSTHEIQFKKRYDVQNGDINAALTQAAGEGLDSASGFDFQVDWGYSKQTLSIAYEKDITISGSSGSGLNMPSEATSRTVSNSNAPTKFKNWTSTGWGTTQLNSSVIYGPVSFNRYEGTFDDLDLDVEVWTVINTAGTGNEYWVEASFKTDSFSEASSERTALINLLRSKGWLVEQDVLRTSQIIERYAPTPDTVAPSVPANVTATASSSTQVNLSWTAATDNVGVVGYEIYRDGTLAGTSTTNSFGNTGLTASTSYSYTVKAKDAAGNVSAASSAVNVTTLAAGTGGTLFYNVDGNTGAYLEAETYTSKNGTFALAACAACSNSQNMETANGSGNASTNLIAYNLQVTNGGSFYIHLLGNGPDGSSDSFYVAIDSGTDTQVTTTSNNTWAWKKTSGTISIPAGAHTLYIKVREDGAKVDKVYLSKSSTLPTGLGAAALAPSYQ
ncbi:fibronectin type III domain-containing protein [Paenibacillus sp. MMS18-CY102]|uniref:fibronectin type III domain-containing protein n=1 Tax=Paenibacillus sp. MMS18-CY102 TaxID=2682849 RepID=UPI001365BF02|nr:fibronectin type III domain-containing protein [Paenibacillus sp. MMS18-CY102]MWC29711.1 fibronectin type III domain-containing protein [Paenibacillus sp. MMS18-CY102]